ncbi:hypothetical protein [Cytobacillus sp. NCCP-133]|uniref:hypothetical protein n=1 Tax=Cytobacillus sp. NCCP-133 TaxID=766848 RepID=UPI00223130AE|nr:hypothetical protein [Cytobacillus sp. NCCP-133]GLB59482.1 hypothetical protein NCCP133_16150 [Cytobacillus sp. NCCP-133]
MKEKNKEYRNNNKKISSEKSEAVQKLAANLIEDEKNLDFGSIFKMANKLLKDDSLKELVEEINKEPRGTIKDLVEEANEDNTDLTNLRKEIGQLKKELEKTQIEVAELKKQNASLLGLYLKVVNAANQDFKKGVGLITGLSKLLK